MSVKECMYLLPSRLGFNNPKPCNTTSFPGAIKSVLLPARLAGCNLYDCLARLLTSKKISSCRKGLVRWGGGVHDIT